MSNVQATIKSATQLITSLADHRKFNSGQISYIYREQIEKPRLEENFDGILKLNQCVCVLDDTFSGDMCNQYDQFKDKLTDQLINLVERTSNLLEIQEMYKEKEEKLLGLAKIELEKQRLERETKAKFDKPDGTSIAED